MKNFFKKLAFVLALAMVVASVAPAATASAAAAPKLNRTSKKLYIGGDVTGDYTDTFDLNVKNKGNNDVTYSTGDEAIAMVDAESGVVTAKGVGNTTITATLKDKDTDKVTKTLTAKFWIKKNADAAGISATSAALLDKPVMVGETVKLNAYRMLGDEKVWSGLKVVTDKYSFVSGDEKVATVDNTGKITAVAPGETTITFHAYQYDAKTATPTTEDVVLKVVVVAKGIVDVKQTTSTKVEVTFGVAQDDTKVTKDTIILTPADATKATPVVKAVTWNEAKTVATVELYVSLDDKVTYTVAIKDTDIKKDFIASVGKVASVTITGPATNVIGTAKKIAYKLFDANGIELPAADDKLTVAFVADATNGYLSMDGTAHAVTVFEKGKSVTIQLEYHTGEYSNEGVETTFKSNAFVVTGVDKTDATIATSKYSVVKGDYAKADFANMKNQITMEDFDYAIEAYVKDSSDDEYKTDAEGVNNFTFESLDVTKVAVDNQGKLYPVAAGVAYVKVTVKPINKSFLVQVVVAGKAKAATITFDQYTATVTQADKTVTFVATIKDQYGNDFTKTFAATDITDKVNNTSSIKEQLSYDGKKITADVSGLAKGTYTFKVTVGDLTRNLTVIVKDFDVPVTYRVKLDKTSIDMARNNSSDGAETVNVTFLGLDKNSLTAKIYEPTTDYTIEIKDSKGDVVSTKNKYDVVSVSGSAITVAKNTGSYTVTLKAVGERITGKADGTVIAVAGFSVVNNQIKPVVKQEATSVKATTVNTDIKKAFTVTTANKSEKVEILEVHGYVVGGNTTSVNIMGNFTANRYVITKVVVKETFDNGNSLNHDISLQGISLVVVD